MSVARVREHLLLTACNKTEPSRYFSDKSCHQDFRPRTWGLTRLRIGEQGHGSKQAVHINLKYRHATQHHKLTDSRYRSPYPKSPPSPNPNLYFTIRSIPTSLGLSLLYLSDASSSPSVPSTSPRIPANEISLEQSRPLRYISSTTEHPAIEQCGHFLKRHLLEAGGMGCVGI